MRTAVVGTDGTAKKKSAIIRSFELGNSVSMACRSARLGRTTYYRWRQDDREFALACEAAIETGTDRLEDEAKRRAMGKDGSDTLLIFLLKARRPDKYKDRVSNEHTGPRGGPILIAPAIDLSKLSDDELALYEQITAKASTE